MGLTTYSFSVSSGLPSVVRHRTRFSGTCIICALAYSVSLGRSLLHDSYVSYILYISI
jgi:hypothetical protein